MPFAAVRESGRLALSTLVFLAGFPVIMPYASAPDGWFGTFIGAAIVLFAFIVCRGLFFLGLWALLGRKRLVSYAATLARDLPDIPGRVQAASR